MIKYTIFPGQTHEAIENAEEIFSMLKKQGTNELPTSSREKQVFLFSYRNKEKDMVTVYYLPLENNTGCFLKKVPDFAGYYNVFSAKFKVE